MQKSLLKTLANKYKSTVTKRAKHYQADIKTKYGIMKGSRVVVGREGKRPLVAEFGGIPLRTKKKVTNIRDTIVILSYERCELIDRLLTEECELCRSREKIEVLISES